MKFGKNLQDAAALLNPEWQPFWINYKALKRLIKQIMKGIDHAEPAEKAGEEEGAQEGGSIFESKVVPIASSKSPRDSPEAVPEANADVTALEKRFLQFLHAELCKTSKFFASAQDAIRRHCSLLQERVRGIEQSKDLFEGTMEIEYGKVMRACLHMYKETLNLEKYALFSYAGFDKILKKHDKCTRKTTRAKYMKHFVQRQDFAKYPQLLQTVSELEALFRDLGSKLSASETPNDSAEDGRSSMSAETKAALLDIPGMSAQMASLTSMQRSTLSPAARTLNTEDEDTAASVLLSVASGLPASRRKEEVDDAADSADTRIEDSAFNGNRQNLRRSAEDAGLDVVGLASKTTKKGRAKRAKLRPK